MSRLLICLIQGESIAFPVTIGHNCLVSELKEEIKRKRELDTLKDVDPHTLELWKPNDSNSIIAKPSDTLVNRIKSLGDSLSQFSNKLEPADSLLSIFPKQPPIEYLHIVVKVPATPQPLLMRGRRTGSNSPVITPNLSLRKRTVEGLYDAMMKERVIYVRGTPGSGKSTLLDLLHQHILEKHHDPFVCVTWSWPPRNIPLSPEQKLNSFLCLEAIIPVFLQQTSPVFLLMDDAQDSFGDGYLWNKFLKDIIDRPSYYRVVVFCSYGSTSTPGRESSAGTPTELRKAACMTLWPRKNEDGVEVNGLLLDQEEFNEVVLRFDNELMIHTDLSQKIFELTVGHVDAVCELLRLIMNEMKTRMRTEGKLTLDTYYEEFSLEYIMDHLSGPFGRGLPRSTGLSGCPEVTDVLRRLLVSGKVTEDCNGTAVQYCHRNGWIYADDSQPEPGPQCYTVASPLHHAALSWRLQPMDSLPRFETPYALSLQVLAKFMPSQMERPIRRVGSGSTHLPPEAQYQDEYFRCLFTVTCGNVRISPEFASARGEKVAGRIDFFIPGVRWGIEITREGDRLNQHASLFKTGGAFSKWLEDGHMSDYVLLDCRTTTPKTSHPDIPNLYHVVFNSRYTEVCVFDNKRNRVWGPKTLQENYDDDASSGTTQL